MTSRARVSLLFLVLLVTPRVAAAQDGFWEWVERLSGPGPFNGFRVELRLACIDRARGDASGAPDDDRSGRMRPATDPDCLFLRDMPDDGSQAGGSRASVAAPGAPPAASQGGPSRMSSGRRPLATIGLGLGYGKSSDNVLEYDPGIPVSARQVRWISLGPSFDVRPHPSFELGAGFSLNWFSGDPFDTFQRFAFHPVRVKWFPLTALDTRDDFLVVAVRSTLFTKGFVDEDFGARPGTYNEPGEMVWSAGIGVDVARLIERVKSR